MSVVSKSTILAVLGLALLVSPAWGQKRRRIEFTPFVGGLIPTTRLGAIRIPGLGSTPIQVTGEMLTAGGFGGGGPAVMAKRFGIRVAWMRSRSSCLVKRSVKPGSRRRPRRW